jgi:hypothetical protein
MESVDLVQPVDTKAERPPHGGLFVRYWHKADIGLRGPNVCFGGKAGIIGPEAQCLLLTQSGHWT